MQGLGLFSCRKDAWPGFHPEFRGFGGEEGYIHQKFRNLGRRCLCLPWLRWVHRFGRPAGAPYPMRLQNRITNYLIGHRELGLDEAPVIEHFQSTASETEMLQAVRDAEAVLPSAAAAAGEMPSGAAILRAKPLISCLCPTFGRCGPQWQHLVEESVEAFLRQTDAHSELLILNDHPAQELVFDHPRVRVVNHPSRYPTLGEKYNAMVSEARGDLLAPWEDDDISLPHRLELARERLGNRDYYNPRRYWFLDPRGLHSEMYFGVGHNLSLFRRRAWQAVGGYPRVTGSQDAEMDSLLASSPKVSCRVDEEPLRLADWYYIYRWGVSPCHLSGENDMQGVYDSLGLGRPPAGRFVLQPHWRQDYCAMVAATVAQAKLHEGHSTASARRRRRCSSASTPATVRLRHHLQAGGRFPLRRRPDRGLGLRPGVFPALRAGGQLPRHRRKAVAMLRRRRRPGRVHERSRRHPAAARARAQSALAPDSAQCDPVISPPDGAGGLHAVRAGDGGSP